MGKKEHDGDDFYSKKSALLRKQQSIAEEIEGLRVPCSHTKKNGKLKCHFIPGGKDDTLVECERCGARFNMAAIRRESLEGAITVLHNAINQIKVFANNPDADEDERRVIIRLGKIDRDLKEILKVYGRTVLENGKDGKKKKKKSGDNFGGSGIDGLLMGRRY